MSRREVTHSVDDGRRISSRELQTLLKVSGELAASLDLAVTLQTSIEAAAEVLGLETGAIYLLDGQMLYLGATTPPIGADFPESLRYADVADHPHIRRCVTENQPVFVADSRVTAFTPAEQVAVDARDLRSILYVPLAVEGRPLGAIIVGSEGEPHELGDSDIDLCRTLSFQVSLAVANARLFESVQQSMAELERAYDATLEGWSAALEMRDEETKGHTERVAGLALRLAIAMGIPDDELPHIRRGALLHDIGKMVVPDSILHKPGPLDDQEWAIMRRHPEHARVFLQKIDYLRPALDIPYCHHERWDGTGYPRGLAGEEIPLAARIFAVIDVYEALTSDRPYRAAWSREEALAHIRAQSGKHFDPAVVEAFMREVDPDGA